MQKLSVFLLSAYCVPGTKLTQWTQIQKQMDKRATQSLGNNLKLKHSIVKVINIDKSTSLCWDQEQGPLRNLIFKMRHEEIIPFFPGT